MDIINFETGETAGTLDEDGVLETESEALRDLVDEMATDDGVPFYFAVPGEGESVTEVHFVGPGDDDFLRAVADLLPSPFEADLGDA